MFLFRDLAVSEGIGCDTRDRWTREFRSPALLSREQPHTNELVLFDTLRDFLFNLQAVVIGHNFLPCLLVEDF